MTNESSEIAQFCSACGTAKGHFDIFCAHCSRPLVRRFRSLLPILIVLFVAAALSQSLAHSGCLPHIFHYAPLAFLAQGVLLCFLRLALRQPRFFLLMALFTVFVTLGISNAGLSPAFPALAPLFLATGALVLWITHHRGSEAQHRLQTLWDLIPLLAWSFAVLAEPTNPFQLPLPHAALLTAVPAGLIHYIAWASLAGLLLTLAIQSAARVARHGIVVKPDYYPAARIIAPPAPAPAFTRKSPYIAAFVVAARIVSRAAIAFHNTLVCVLNVLTRALVFAWQIKRIFISSLAAQTTDCARRLLELLTLAAVRVALPLLAVYIAASITLRSSALVESHVFSPTLGSTWHVLSASLQLVVVIFAAGVTFARTAARQFAESYLRDLAIATGYALPLLLLLTIVLTIASIAARHLLHINLGFSLGPLSCLCLLILAISAIGLWRRQATDALRRLRQKPVSPSAG